MNYYKSGNSYIATVGTLTDAEQISQEEYETHWADVQETISHYPDEPTETEILSILLGGAE